MRLPSTTLYWGLLKEVGVWPFRKVSSYQRLLLFQTLMISEEDRLGRIGIVERILGIDKQNVLHRKCQ